MGFISRSSTRGDVWLFCRCKMVGHFSKTFENICIWSSMDSNGCIGCHIKIINAFYDIAYKDGYQS